MGDWIIKPPSTRHRNVPFNEFTTMTLAAAAGVDIPEIRHIELNKLKNIPHHITPRLSPAYDIVTTSVYIDGEKKFALSLGKTKEWFKLTLDNFAAWAVRSGIPWRAIRPHLSDTMEKARETWPARLKELPIDDDHKERLKSHWKNLQPDFRILTEL